MNSTFWTLLQWIAMMGMLKVLSDTSIRPTLAEPSFPRKWESRISGFQSFPIDSRRVGGPDSRLRGNDGFRDYGVVGDDGSGILLRPPRACKRRAI
ncbi:hypothetical protein EX512_08770, partial [Neisseria gonorrhoeae]